MKEITRVVTAEITTIHKGVDENELMSRDDCEQYEKILMDNMPEMDNIHVVKIQDFVRKEE